MSSYRAGRDREHDAGLSMDTINISLSRMELAVIKLSLSAAMDRSLSLLNLSEGKDRQFYEDEYNEAHDLRQKIVSALAAPRWGRATRAVW